MRKSLISLSFVLVLALLLPAVATADTRLDMKSHTDAFQAMGQSQPARDTKITVWVGDDRALRNDGETATLVRLDQKKLYVIDHGAKTFTPIALPVDFAALMPAESREQMKQMLEMMQMKATVKATGETREINGWAAKRYDVSLTNQMGMTIASEVWATKAIAMDMEAFRGLTRALFSLQPGGGAAMEELQTIDGVPVLMKTTVKAMGGEYGSREEVVSAKAGTAPAGTYEVPKGYKEAPFNPMSRAGR